MKDFLTPFDSFTAELLEPAIVKRLVKEKRGQGYGKHYKPFLTVRDSRRQGRVHRRPSITHGRIVHLLSDLELAAFILFDWNSSVIDIREQFPLDPKRTLDIAQRLGIKHPYAKGTCQVMTTSLLLDIKRDGKMISQAVSIQYRSHLENKRNVEKKELERRYWDGEEIEWFLFTENEVPVTLIQNIKWLIPHMYSFDLNEVSQVKTFELIQKAIETFPEDKIAVVLKTLDEQQGNDRGTHLAYLRHLLAQNAFTWDMLSINHRSLRTRDLIPSVHWLNEDYEYVHAQ